MVNANADNDGYAISLGYNQGPLTLLANWSRLVDSGDSYVWNVGAGYAFGPAKVTLGYERTKDKGWNQGNRAASWVNASGVQSEQDNWMLGLEWKMGPGRIQGLVNYVNVDDSNLAALNDKDALKYSLGYTWDLSKRTAFYVQGAYSNYDNPTMAAFYRGNGVGYRDFGQDDNVWAFAIGMTHKF